MGGGKEKARGSPDLSLHIVAREVVAQWCLRFCGSKGGPVHASAGRGLGNGGEESSSKLLFI